MHSQVGPTLALAYQRVFANDETYQERAPRNAVVILPTRRQGRFVASDGAAAITVSHYVGRRLSDLGMDRCRARLMVERAVPCA